MHRQKEPSDNWTQTARLSVYSCNDIIERSTFPKEWFATTATSLKMARNELHPIVTVTKFRITIGVTLTNILGGADPASELKKATEAFQPRTRQVKPSVRPIQHGQPCRS